MKKTEIEINCSVDFPRNKRRPIIFKFTALLTTNEEQGTNSAILALFLPVTKPVDALRRG